MIKACSSVYRILQFIMANETKQSARFEFPSMLYDMLEDVSKDPKLSKIVSWMPHGRAFKVHRPDDFEALVMPKYFRERYSSFRYLLEQWGYQGLRKGRDRGAYYNIKFVRGERDSIVDATKEFMLQAMPEYLSPKDEPDFYRMAPPKIQQHAPKNQSVVDDNNRKRTHFQSQQAKSSTFRKAKDASKKTRNPEPRNSPKKEKIPVSEDFKASSSKSHDTEDDDFADAINTRPLRHSTKKNQNSQHMKAPSLPKTAQSTLSGSFEASSPKPLMDSSDLIKDSKPGEVLVSPASEDSHILLVPSKPIFSGFGLPFKKLRLIVLRADELKDDEAFVAKRLGSVGKRKNAEN